MLCSNQRQPQRVSRVVLNVMTALLMLVAAPAIANVTIEGVANGQVVTGDLEVSAVSTDNRLLDITIILTGPEGTAIVNRSGANRVFLVNEPGDATKGTPWDSTQAAAGKYSVTAFAASRGRTGRTISSQTVNFYVQNDNAVEPVAAPTPSVPTPTEAPVAEDGTPDVIQIVNPETVEPTPESTPEPTAVEPPVTQPQPDSQPLSQTTGDATVAFAANTPTQRIVGDSATINIELDSPATDADVLFLVWDLDRKAVVNGVSATLTPGNLTVASSLLDQLPVGNLELQAHYREDGKIVQTAKHVLVNAEPTPQVEPVGPEAMPTVSFPADAPKTRTLGSTQGLSFEVEGDLPESGDILAIAWSIDEGRLVPGFAQVFSEGPWTISADLLNLLPKGQVEVQLRPRYNGQILGKVVNAMTVSGANVADLPDPADPADPVEGDDAQADSGDDTPTTETPVVDATPDPGNDPVDTPGETPADNGGNATPDGPVASNIAFAAGTTSRYTPGSGDAITLDLDGVLPADGDVLMLMWHKDNSEMVTGFAHELTGSNLQVSTAKLDAVPAGNVELQALLRVPGQAIVIRKMSMFIVDPDAPEDEQVADDTSDESPNYDGLNLTSDGFTKFTKSSDTRVIYVAANGNDSNDGLSTAKPMRTAKAAYAKLRHGKPDWLLFKAGDTFRGNLGTISKSGRSANEPILISTYGEGPRPIFLSPSDTWAEKFFQTNGDYVAFVGLHIIAENRDPNRSGFNSSSMSSDEWNASAITYLGDAKGLLIEDCVMEYFKFAIVVQSTPNDGYARDIQIRRNAVLHSYGHWDKKVAGHSSGMYGAYIDGLLIEENVWHHNGWSTRVSGAGKTKFNHNIYIQDNCTGNSVVRGNILSEGSAHGLQLRSGGDVTDNLFVGNPLAFFVGRYESDVLRNVVMKSQDMGDEARGHGIEILPCLYARVENNIISQKQGSASFAYAIGFNYNSTYNNFLNGRPFKASLKDNKVYQWPRDNGSSSAIKFGTKPTMTANTRNDLDKASGGDTNPPWIDPDRDVESYMASIGQTASLDALIQAASFRPRRQWAEEFSAEAINLYIRRGFDVRPFD